MHDHCHSNKKKETVATAVVFAGSGTFFQLSETGQEILNPSLPSVSPPPSPLGSLTLTIPRNYRVYAQKNGSIEVNPSQMKLNLTEETEIKWILKGFYYLVERGKEKLHLFEVILKTPLTHTVTFN